MSLLIFIVVVLIVLALAIYGCGLVLNVDRGIIRLIQLVCIVIAIVVILQRAGIA